MNDASTKIRLESVTKIFGVKDSKRRQVPAVENVTLEIPTGEFAVMLGPSGCGKTTILRLIAGLETPTSGVVGVNEKAVAGPSKDRGMVFQTYTTFPWLTVKENIQFGLAFENRGPGHEIETLAQSYVDLVGLRGFENAYPGTLSGGMRQRVAIARTLISDPDIILMDEPFGALDSQTRAIMQEQLEQIWEHLDKTIVFVTHDLEEAIFLADSIFVLTPRPARLKQIVRVPLPRPRAAAIKTSDEFLELRRALIEMTHADAAEVASSADSVLRRRRRYRASRSQ